MENVHDMMRKGRYEIRVVPSGEDHYNARLTASDVRTIRARLADGEAGISLARDFGVSNTQISRIRLRKSWMGV